jgi:tripartite-type tricarboxylate transporter receptor subunit TctC
MSYVKRLLLTAALISGSEVAMAQDWPTKPIRLIVPQGPASTVDILARTYGDELRKSLGQNIIVDNKTGAGGNIASAEAARAAPDGYTMLLIAQATMVFNMALYAKPGYDSLRDFEGVAVTSGVSNVLVVNPGNPAKTVTDLIAQAKARPGELTYSSGGTGTSHHMSGVLLERNAGISMQHVPYRTTPAGILGVVNGEVVFGFYNTPTVIGQIKGGKLKPIAVTSKLRSELLPDVPTMIEQGVNGYVVNTWFGFAVPKGVPQPVVARLNAELNRISQILAVRDKLKAQGIDMMPPEPPSGVEKLVREDLAIWVPIIKASGISAD